MKKLIDYVRKYPYFYMLVVSGLCMACYVGVDKVNIVVRERKIESSQTMKEQPSKELVEAETAPPVKKEIIKEETSTPVTEAPDNQEQEIQVGVTKFEEYEPKKVSSPYYQDPGKIAITTDYPYEAVDMDYFDDAAFIGDSRTLGLSDYSDFKNSDYFCDNGFCAYLWSKGKKVMHQNSGKEVLLEDAMSSGKNYGKIYLMVGLNDCGYGTIEKFKERYKNLVDMLHEKQPDAVIYLLANLHLSKTKSDSDDVFNNVDVNAHNVAVAECADGISTFYLDVNGMFTDKSGYLKEKLTFDGTHLYADGYKKWANEFKKYAVVR